MHEVRVKFKIYVCVRRSEYYREIVATFFNDIFGARAPPSHWNKYSDQGKGRPPPRWNNYSNQVKGRPPPQRSNYRNKQKGVMSSIHLFLFLYEPFYNNPNKNNSNEHIYHI